MSVGEINTEGEEMLHLAQDVDLAIVNTFHSKRREHLLTYKNEEHSTVNDYFIVRREYLRELKTATCDMGSQLKHSIACWSWR